MAGIPVMIFGIKDGGPKNRLQLPVDNYFEFMRFLTKDTTDFHGSVNHEVSTELCNCNVSDKDEKVYALPPNVHVIAEPPKYINLYHNCQNTETCDKLCCFGCENLVTSCNKLKPYCH